MKSQAAPSLYYYFTNRYYTINGNSLILLPTDFLENLRETQRQRQCKEPPSSSTSVPPTPTEPRVPPPLPPKPSHMPTPTVVWGRRLVLSTTARSWLITSSEHSLNRTVKSSATILVWKRCLCSTWDEDWHLKISLYTKSENRAGCCVREIYIWQSAVLLFVTGRDPTL